MISMTNNYESIKRENFKGNVKYIMFGRLIN